MNGKGRFLKILTALFIFLGFFFLAGVWRLSESPLRLPVHFAKIRTFVQQYGVDFEEIYLFSPSLFSLPGILIQKGYFENEGLDFRAENIFMSWKLGSLFSHKKSWKISQVTLEAPHILFKNNQSSAGVPSNMDIPAITIKNGTFGNLPNGTILPPHSVNGTFYQEKGRTLLHFYIESNKTTINGTLSIQGDHIKMTGAIRHFLPKDWISFIPEESHGWCNFFENHIPLIDFSFNGRLRDRWPEGFLTINIQAPFKENNQIKTVPVRCHLGLTHTETMLKISLATKTEAFPWAGLKDLWPTFLSPNVRSWCIDRIQGGEAHPVDLVANLSWNKETHDVRLEDLNGTLGVSHGNVRYMDSMPLVEDAIANATFTADEFIIQIPQGSTENLNVTKGTVRFIDLQTDDPQGVIDLTIEGPLTQALWVADHPPFRFASQYHFDPRSVSGHSKTKLVMKFPTTTVPTLDTMKPTVVAHIQDFAMKKKIAGQQVQLKKGSFTLNITKDLLSLKGTAFINGTRGFIHWEESFAKNPKFLRRYQVKLPMTVTKLLSFTPPAVQDFVKTAPEFSFKDQVLLNLDYMDVNPQDSLLILNLDLKNSAVTLPLFQYEKKMEEPGTLFLRLLFKKEIIHAIDRFHLTAKDLNIKGTCTFNKAGNLTHMQFQDIHVNKSQLTGYLKKEKDLWKLALKGPDIVLPPIIAFYKNLPDTPENKSQTNLDIAFDFPSVFLDNDIVFYDIKGTMAWREGALHHYDFRGGSVEKPTLTLQYGPQGNEMKLSLKTSVMNDILKGFDWTETITAGDVTINATKPLNATKKPLIGKMDVRNFRIKNAPILAKLLSLISIEGLLSTLTGEGILFVTGEADFEYLDKKIAIPHLELTSSSLGITAKGYVDLKENRIDTTGYIIPANLLNQIIGNIPLIGNILSGGSKEHKGLVSMSYSMKGPLGDPEVSSDPLSVLAPNFVKGLFSSLTGSGKEVPSLSKTPAYKSQVF